MTNKRDLIIAVLATFCLTTALFFAMPTKSQTSQAGTNTSPTYNPLADLNHDGTVDIYDAISFAGVFNSNGDPTLNVTISSHASELIKDNATLNSATSGWSSGLIYVEGYTKFNVNIFINSSASGGIVYYLITADNSGNTFVADTQNPLSEFLVKNYDAMNMYMEVSIYTNGIPTQLYVDIYLTA